VEDFEGSGKREAGSGKRLNIEVCAEIMGIAEGDGSCNSGSNFDTYASTNTGPNGTRSIDSMELNLLPGNSLLQVLLKLKTLSSGSKSGFLYTLLDQSLGSSIQSNSRVFIKGP
jgi:hypothetical protein